MKKLVPGKLYYMLENRTALHVSTKEGITIPKDSPVIFMKIIQKKTRDSNLIKFTVLYRSQIYLVHTGFSISDVLKEVD